MNWWEALLLGLIQGASEFLPVSSSGHLLLFEKLGLGEENLFFNIMLHVATLLAVLIAMRKEWVPLIKKPFQKKTGYILIASLPTVAIALIFKTFLPDLIDGAYLATGFMATALLLVASEKLSPAQTSGLDAKRSALTGVMQGVAVLPGISRSGSTIAAMRLAGVEKTEACSFSFLLSIPIIIGSALMESVPFMTGSAALSVAPLPLIIGMLAAFISGLLSINLFIKMVKTKSLFGFAVYTFALSVVSFFVL